MSLELRSLTEIAITWVLCILWGWILSRNFPNSKYYNSYSLHFSIWSRFHFQKLPLNRDLVLTLNPLFSSYRQFILPDFERPYLGQFLSKFDYLYVHGNLIKSFTILIRGIFLIWGQIHAYLRCARLLRQFCTVLLKRL